MQPRFATANPKLTRPKKTIATKHVTLRAWLWIVSLLLTLIQANSSLAQTVSDPIALWPAQPPGRNAATGAEADTSTSESPQVAGQSVIRLGNVSHPTLTIYQPENQTSDAAVLVCPGGGYHILAMDLEGTEVCEWLNSIGVTAAVLKYRVPRPEGAPRPIEALQDAQRAMSLLRERAEQLRIDPQRIGVLGFSAGGHLAARMSTNYEQRSYAAIDAVDQVSCRPDFAILIYPAYLFDKESQAWVSEELPITADTPPVFMSMAADDPVDASNVLRFALGLKQAEVPVELHLYPDGGHGYGLRSTDFPATTWASRAADWMRYRGWAK